MQDLPGQVSDVLAEVFTVAIGQCACADCVVHECFGCEIGDRDALVGQRGAHVEDRPPFELVAGIGLVDGGDKALQLGIAFGLGELVGVTHQFVDPKGLQCRADHAQREQRFNALRELGAGSRCAYGGGVAGGQQSSIEFACVPALLPRFAGITAQVVTDLIQPAVTAAPPMDWLGPHAGSERNNRQHGGR